MFVSGAAVVFFSDIPFAINLGYKTGENAADVGTVILSVMIQVALEIPVDILACGYEKSQGLPLEAVWDDMVSAPLAPPVGLQDQPLSARGRNGPI